MFAERSLSAELRSVRNEHAPGAIVLDTERDFETLPPAAAESLGLFVDSLAPVSYPEAWLLPDAPDLLWTYASEEFTVGMPGDGGVTWTAQTTPPTVLIKPRLVSSPEAFVDFLIADALVQVGLDEPEHFLGFFEERYREFDAAVPLGPADTYQLAAALYEAYLGLYTRDAFETWEDTHPALFDAWQDAGERLRPRLSDLPNAIAMGRTDFADAAELACSAVRHGVAVPTPFGTLDTGAYREYGPDYAIRWARKTFEQLD